MAMDDASRTQLRETLRSYAPRLADAIGGPHEAAALELLGIALISSGTADQNMILQQFLEQPGGLPDFLRPRLNAAEAYWIAHYLPEQTMSLQESRHDLTVRRLAYITTIGFFILIAMLLGASFVAQAGQVVGEFRDVLLTMTGVVGTGWATVISFYFGAGVGTRQQAQTISSVIDPLMGSAMTTFARGQPSMPTPPPSPRSPGAAPSVPA